MLQLLSTVSPGILGNYLYELAKKSALHPGRKANYRLRSYGLPLMMVLALGFMLRVEAWAQPAGWQYYSRIAITENSGLNVADYQLLLTLNTQELVAAGQMNANGDDIRFGADLSGNTLLSYWIESDMNTSNTKIWVKIPLLAANVVTYIYLFYGNNSASAESNIDGTFIGPHSSTDSIDSGNSGGVTNSQRGFRFAPNEDILVKRFGKREPDGSTRYVTLFDFNSQAILRQHEVSGPAGQYIYSDLGSPIWLTQDTQYLLELYQGSNDGYYFGVSSQIGTHLTYYDMRYCNSCTQNTFPSLVLNGYQYGYPDFHYYTKNNVTPPPTYYICPPEICNGIDDNCDGNVDEGVQTIYYRDFDTDGFGNPSSVISACSQPSGYVANGTDCNDLSAVEKPGQIWYKDTDNDGYAETGAATITQCLRPVGYKAASELTSITGDCNDNAAAINPAASEICDNIDNNCNGMTDEGLTFITYYTDADNDGFGTGSGQSLCANPGPGFATQAGDCNDDPATGGMTNPDATEICDNIDNNCNGMTDEGLTFITYYTDADNDGFGTGSGQSLCANPGPGFATQAGDCNDDPATGGMTNPDATEICDNIDNNCNGMTDEGLTFITYYTDADNDGFGTGSGQSLCANPGPGFATQAGDCNDDPATGGMTNPDATEICDNIDNNCNGMTDEGVQTTFYRDMDGDGFGNPAVTQLACSAPMGYVANDDDCDDTNGAIKPGATEVCDGVDNNCDGTIDNILSGGGVWQNTNVGTANGNATYPPCDAQPNDVFTIQASGFSTSNSDQLHLVYQQLCGNVELIARVTGVNSGGWAGITLRESLMPGSKKVALKTQSNGNIRREIRTTINGAVNNLNYLRPAHSWLRLVRNGSNFVGYTSTDGTNWTFAFSATVSMTGCIYVGLFSESINANVVTTATFDNVQINGGVLPLIQAPQTPVAASSLSPEVYPNPTTGEVNIDLSSYANPVGTVKVFDAYGKLVLQKQLDGSPLFGMKINGADGVYSISIEVEGETPVTKRVVIAH